MSKSMTLDEKNAYHKHYRDLWRANNPDKVKAQTEAWNSSEHGKATKRLWQENNRVKVLEATRNRKAKIRLAILNAYGNKCVKCGYNTDPRALDLDHINNDGNSERKRLKVNSLNEHVYRNNFPTTYQLLCRNCNWIKYRNQMGQEVE